MRNIESNKYIKDYYNCLQYYKFSLLLISLGDINLIFANNYSDIFKQSVIFIILYNPSIF